MHRQWRCNSRKPPKVAPDDAAERGHARGGIDLFIENGAYTTLASAVAILVVLTLLFSSVTAVWSLSRAGDVQVSADATALAGANVVSSYSTAATAVDACILSLGLAGLCITGVGLVGLLIPGVNTVAGDTVEAGLKILDMRNDFAESASTGLQKIEKSLPYLVAANSVNVCMKQSTSTMTYTGVALAVPQESASEFSALDGESFDTDALEDTADDLDDAADKLAEAAEERAKANEAAWLVDCGREGANMQERAARLSGLSSAENPDYATSITWEPNVGLRRARAYYRWRYNHDPVVEGGTEGAADAAARHVFFGLALEYLENASVEEVGGVCVSTVKLLPKNMAEIKQTHLYTDAIWPASVEDGNLVMHYAESCPGNTGGISAYVSFAQQDDSAECEECRFGIGDVGKTPMASTSISNGFEYHLREFMLALDDYVDARNKELELERKAKAQTEETASVFEEALDRVANKRPRIAPPGRYGCVALVVSGEAAVPGSLKTSFADSSNLSARGAVSAAVLAPDAATKENNVLSRFFSSFESKDGGGAAGLVNDVMGLWGRLLVGYGDIQSELNSAIDGLTAKLKPLGLSKLGTWLDGAVNTAVKALDIEPVDLSLKKPVLTDSANVIAHTDIAALRDVQGALRSIPLGTTDPAALLQYAGGKLGDYILDTTFTLAEIPLPGGGKIPLKIKLRDVVGGSK